MEDNINIKIDLGRDGNPQGTPPSAWVIIKNGEMRFEVECYKEAWCELDMENTAKLFHLFDCNDGDNNKIEQTIKERFIQSKDFKNFDLLDKLQMICKQNDIKYKYNSWCDLSDR